MSAGRISVAFVETVQMLERLGLSWLPRQDGDGCLEHSFPPWAVAVNGDPTRDRLDSFGGKVGPLSIAVYYEGAFAGFVTVSGGIMIADGEEGQAEARFIEAVKAEEPSS